MSARSDAASAEGPVVVTERIIVERDDGIVLVLWPDGTVRAYADASAARKGIARHARPPKGGALVQTIEWRGFEPGEVPDPRPVRSDG